MTKNVVKPAKVSSVETKRIYFVLDVEAVLLKAKNPVRVLLLTEHDCQDMVAYYGGGVEAYTDYKSAMDAKAWYLAN